MARHEISFLFIFVKLTSAQSAVAQGNLLYMFARANTQSAQNTVARSSSDSCVLDLIGKDFETDYESSNSATITLPIPGFAITIDIE